MKALWHLLIDILSSWFLASLALSVWLLLAAGSTTVHQGLFDVVPPDGAVTPSERIAIDRGVSQYLVWGEVVDLSLLTQTEQKHMQEVRTILVGVLFKLIVSIMFLAVVYRHVDSHSTRGALAIVALLALLSALAFEGLFVGMHQVFFVNSQWILPSDQFVLTQVYPEAFFAYAWGGILLCSILSLVLIQLVLRRQKA